MIRRAETAYAASLFALLSAAAGGVFLFEQPGGSYGPRTAEFVNWETPQVHPLEITSDGSTLLAANTAGATLMVFDVTGGSPVQTGEIPVGIEPVTVRVRSATEAWVVNHLSDSISVVDLPTLRVVRTIKTGDEPCDVVFGGVPARAFVTCSHINVVQVFDPDNLDAAPLSIAIEGEEPRSLAVSPDGQFVYAAVFESGNNTTVLGGGAVAGTIAFPPNVVSDPTGPYGGVNPPPNSGNAFVPPRAPGQPTPPRVGLIVRKNESGQWMDDNARDWTNLVSGPQAFRSGRPTGWTLVDQDLAVIRSDTLSVTYATGLMNICMSVGVNPATGDVAVIGTDATNEKRFEPNLNGRFLRVNMAIVDPGTLQKNVVDLNPHLDYSVSSIPAGERLRAIGDPRAIVWNSAGTRAYVAGMGSNNVVVVDSDGARAGLAETIPVGEGPTGLALDAARARLYVLNRFDASISTIDTVSESELSRTPFFDPTPAPIKVGRKHLYDTHRNSGLGHTSCASCHVDARMDRLAWDLGDPSGAVDPLTGRNLGFGLPGLSPGTANPPFQAFHPMKGPMTTQTLQDIIGHEPHHWRGDRLGLEQFAPAFHGLQGADQPLSPSDMEEFEAFLATIHFGPNPHRNLDNTLKTSLPLPGHFRTGRFGNAGQPLPTGNPVNGLSLYRSTARRLDNNAFACVTCHTLPTGTGPDYTFTVQNQTYNPIAAGPNGERHHALVSTDGSTQTAIKVPQIRNVGEKVGFNTTQVRNTAGFGFLHDGSVDSIERFVAEPIFTVASDQEIADLVAFLLSFSGSDLPQGQPTGNPLEPPGTPSQDTHAAVGVQTTLRDHANPAPGQDALISQMFSLADANRVGLVAHGRHEGRVRGYAYTGGGIFQTDRSGEQITSNELRARAVAGGEVTYTLVPEGSETRLGVDRDLDGVLNNDGPECNADVNCDGSPDQGDVACMILAVAGDVACFCQADPDFNQDGSADQGDVAAIILVVAGQPCP